MNRIKFIETLLAGALSDVNEGGSIADKDKLKAIGQALVAAFSVLGLVKFSLTVRAALLGKGFAGQRQLSQAYQAFLARRPDYAARAQIDPKEFDDIIDLDGALDALSVIISQLRLLVGDGMLVLSAQITGRTGAVLNFVRALLAAPGDDDARSLVELRFLSILKTLAEKQQLLSDQQGRRERKIAPLVQAKNAQAAQRTVQAAISGLRNDAHTGADLGQAAAASAPVGKLGKEAQVTSRVPVQSVHRTGSTGVES